MWTVPELVQAARTGASGWAYLVAEWERAIVASRAGDSTLLRVFINTRLAETFDEQGDRADQHALRKRAADIPVGAVLRLLCGHPVAMLACFVDSGGHHAQQMNAYCRAHQHAHAHAVKGQSQSGKARLVTRYIKGHPKLEWVKPAGKRNEALDGAVYSLAAAHYVGHRPLAGWRMVEVGGASAGA